MATRVWRVHGESIKRGASEPVYSATERASPEDLFVLARGARRQRKAWGGAQRNPRTSHAKTFAKPAERATEVGGCRLADDIQ